MVERYTQDRWLPRWLLSHLKSQLIAAFLWLWLMLVPAQSAPTVPNIATSGTRLAAVVVD